MRKIVFYGFILCLLSLIMVCLHWDFPERRCQYPSLPEKNYCGMTILEVFDFAVPTKPPSDKEVIINIHYSRTSSPQYWFDNDNEKHYAEERSKLRVFLENNLVGGMDVNYSENRNDRKSYWRVLFDEKGIAFEQEACYEAPGAYHIFFD